MLKKHDGVSEVFVCGDCIKQFDLAGSHYEGYTKEQADSGECPQCGGTNTNWLFDDDCEHDWTIESTKFRREFRGTVSEAIELAEQLDEEYQPAYGTQVSRHI